MKPCRHYYIIIFAFLLLTFNLSSSLSAQPVSPSQPIVLWRAHAHNDYEQERPLHEALERGVGSIEVDIHLVDGQLLVAHDLDKVTPEKSLKSMYLAPLRSHIQANNGKVYSEGGSLILLIDIKSDAEATYEVLKKLLEEYSDILTRFEEEMVIEGAVTVIISGNRPRDMMLAETIRWAAYDGRLEDLGQTPPIPVSFMPLISSNWKQIARWFGTGAFTETSKLKLIKMVNKAHGEGRKIRFWATSDNVRVWEVLYEAGVDYLNADDLARVQGFLLEKKD